MLGSKVFFPWTPSRGKARDRVLCLPAWVAELLGQTSISLVVRALTNNVLSMPQQSIARVRHVAS